MFSLERKASLLDGKQVDLLYQMPNPHSTSFPTLIKEINEVVEKTRTEVNCHFGLPPECFTQLKVERFERTEMDETHFDSPSHELLEKNMFLIVRNQEKIILKVCLAPEIYIALDGSVSWELLEFTAITDGTLIMETLRKNFGEKVGESPLHYFRQPIASWHTIRRTLKQTPSLPYNLYIDHTRLGLQDYYCTATLQTCSAESKLAPHQFTEILGDSVFLPVRSKLCEYLCSYDPALYKRFSSLGFVGGTYAGIGATRKDEPFFKEDRDPFYENLSAKDQAYIQQGIRKFKWSYSEAFYNLYLAKPELFQQK